MELIPSQRARFDLPDDVTYLNCAYMSPLADTVIAAGELGLRAKARPWSLAPADFFPEAERIRTLFGALINADPEGVALIPAASYGIAVAARNLPFARGQAILVLEEQFPSNVYAWRDLARAREGTVLTVRRPADGRWTEAVLDALHPGVAIAALPQCHWTDGALLDLRAISERCRACGTRLVLDLTQSAGALPFDTSVVQPDFVVCAGYKWMMGPYSLGTLYAAPQWRDGESLEQNWAAREGAEDFSALVSYRDDYQRGARRYDVGERANFILAPKLSAGLRLLLGWGVDRVAHTLGHLTASLAERAEAIGLSSLPPERRAGHFLGLTLPPGATADTARALAEQLARANIYVSVRGATVRVTPHVYNTERDLERFLTVLAHSARGARSRAIRTPANPPRSAPPPAADNSTGR